MTLRTALLVFLPIIAVVLGFVVFIPHANKVEEEGPLVPPLEERVPAVSIRDVFKKGTHTITGVVIAPNPCTNVSALALLGTDPPETILVSLTVPNDIGICLQEATPMTFSVSIAAPTGVPILVSVNGVSASTTHSKQ